jgi:LPXTG-motif cell wall-anchored protein
MLAPAVVLQFSGLLEDPIFLALVGLMLLLVFLGYLLVRRTLLSLREGYDEGYR